MNNKLLEILNKSVSTGSFYGHGTISKATSEISDFELEIKDVGPVQLPVNAEQAEQIIRRCERAPYGQGSTTLVDINVRNVWELSPRKLKIKHAGWKKQLADLVKTVGKQLGVEGQTIKAQLYKLLVYEKGSFFVTHQDTEKTDGMFATLIVSLPSQHTGGTLLISHNGEQKKVSFGGKKSKTDFQYVSFYADCSHEIKPIASGYRICLVYNLSIPKKKSMPLSGKNRNIEQKVTDLLETWAEEMDEPEKKIFLFDHQYTPAEFSLINLKNKDHINGDILYQATQQARCKAHLALLTFHQNGEPENDYDYYNRGRYYGRRGYYDDDNDDDDDGSDHEMGEVFEEDLSVTQWFNIDGQPIDMGSIALSKNEIIANINFTDKEPDESDYEGYMGNYGPSLDRWYHRAALIIWPNKYHYAIVVLAGPAASVPELAALIKTAQLTEEPERAALLANCRKFASIIIEHGQFKPAADNASVLLMLQSLAELQDESLAKDFFQKIFNDCCYGDEGPALASFLDTMGWKKFEPELNALFANEKGSTEKMGKLLKGLYKNIASNDDNVEKIEILETLAEHLVNNIALWDKDNYRDFYFDLIDYDDTKSKSHQKRINIIRSLLEDCFPLFAENTLNNLINYFTSTEDRYPLHGVLIPLLEYYKNSVGNEISSNPAIEQLVKSIIDILKNRTSSPIKIPDDWKMSAKWQCDCKDCLILKDFLKNPLEKSMNIKMAKNRRQHMHQVIDRNVVDVSHQTIRKGSPYTLVFEKNRNSFQEKERLWQKELKTLTDFQESKHWFTQG